MEATFKDTRLERETTRLSPVAVGEGFVVFQLKILYVRDTTGQLLQC